MKHGFRYLWRILVILLVNVLIIALAGNFGGSVQTLSKVGSTGEEVRQIQTKLKEYGVYTGEVDGIYGTRHQERGHRVPKIQRPSGGRHRRGTDAAQAGDLLRRRAGRVQQQ